LAEKVGLSANLVLIGWDGKKIAWPNNKQPDLIVYTSTPSESYREEIFALKDCTLITTDENFFPEIPNLVAMDNFQAGRLSARKLVERGYRRPAFLGWKMKKTYKPFEKRAVGFMAGLAEANLNAADSVRWHGGDTQAEMLREIPAAIDKILDEGFDSMFYYSDPKVDLVYDLVAAKRNIPGEFGLITLNSFNVAIGHNPPIDSISHGTSITAETLVKEIVNLISTGRKTFSPRLLSPSYHPGATLRQCG